MVLKAINPRRYLSNYVKDQLICNLNHPWKPRVTLSSLWNPSGQAHPLIFTTWDWYYTGFRFNSISFNTCLNIYFLSGPVLGPGRLHRVLYDFFFLFISCLNAVLPVRLWASKRQDAADTSPTSFLESPSTVLCKEKTDGSSLSTELHK